MAKTNKFYGVIVSFATVSTYYPVNSNYPNFGGFIFQQMINDGTKANDDYTLTAFAVNVDGSVLNGGAPLSVSPSPAVPVPAKKKVQFANMKLNLVDLAVLYPPGANSDLRVDPTDFYKTTNYVAYTAETTSTHSLAVIKRPVNPSPPA